MSTWQSFGGFVLVLYSKCGEAAGCVPVSWQRFIRQQKRRSEVSSAGELWRLRFFLRSAERDEQVSQPRRDGDWTRPTGTRGEGGRLGTRGEEEEGGIVMKSRRRTRRLCAQQMHKLSMCQRGGSLVTRGENRLYEWAETLHFIHSDTSTKPEVDQLCEKQRLLKLFCWMFFYETRHDLLMIMIPAAVTGHCFSVTELNKRSCLMSRYCTASAPCCCLHSWCDVSGGAPAQVCVCAWSVFGAQTHHSAPRPELPACASSWPQAHWPEEDDEEESFSLIRMINYFYNY